MFAILALLTGIASLNQAPASTGKIRITWVTDNNPVRSEQIALFMKLHPDIEVAIDPLNNEQQKVIVQAIAGVGPDVFDSYGRVSLENYVRSGIAYDLTDEFAKVGIKAEEIVWPVAKSSFYLDKRVYGFPCNVAANAIWYNKDLFDTAKVPYPKDGWSWGDLIATAKKLTIPGAGGRYKQFGIYWDFGMTYDLQVQFGGRRFSADGTRCLIDSEASIAGTQLSQDMLYKFKIAPSPAQEAALATQGGWGQGGLTFLLGGKVAMATGGRWWLNRLRVDGKGLRLGAVEMPYLVKPATMGGARCAMVNRLSKNRNAAVKFALFLTSPEYNQLLNDQADALAPVKAASYTDRFLLNPEHPEEDYNKVWRGAVEKAVPEEFTPFAKGAELSAINDQLDLVKANSKSARAAMVDAAANMNRRIRRNARIKPSLTKLFFELTGDKP